MRAKIFCAFFVLCFTYGFSLPVFADGKSEAAAFVNDLGKNALSVITDKAKSDKQKNAALEGLFVKNVDIDWIAKFVVGRSWKAATEEQKKQYLANYRTFLVVHYTSNFAEFTDANFEVTKVMPDDSGGNIVTMRIKRPQAEDVVVDYTVKKISDGNLKIYDITVEGVSMITTQRSDFTSVIAQNGFDYLISQLAARSKKDKTS